MSTSVLKALPGKLDTKRHSPSILYILSAAIMCVHDEEYSPFGDVCQEICPSLLEGSGECISEEMGSFEGCYCRQGYFRNGKTMILAWKN